MSDLDTRLTEAGDLWRGGLGADPPLEELFERVRRDRRRWPFVLAVAAVVALLAVGVALVTIREPARHHAAALLPSGRRDRPVQPDKTARADPTVAHSTGSRTTPSSGPAPSTGACSDDFTVQPTRFVDGRAIVWLTYVGKVPCLIDTYGPLADLTKASGGHQYGFDTSFVGRSPRFPEVRPGDMVTTRVYWSSRCRTGPDFGSDLVLHLDNIAEPRTSGVPIPVTGAIAAKCLPGFGPSVGTSWADIRRTNATTVVRLAVRYVGGPGPGPGTSTGLRPAAFTLRYPRHDDQDATSNAGHSVVVRVPAGSYVLHSVSGSAACPDRTITVPVDRAIAVTVTCSIK